MEESEKRKERLKAMRMEAAQPGVDIDSQSSEVTTHGLSNPLIESESASTTQYASPRFDYYTNPMSAFSGRSRKNNTTPQISHGHYNTQRPIYPSTTPPPPYQSPPYQNPPYHNPPYQNPPYQNPPYQNQPYQNPAINSPGPRTFQVPQPQPRYNQIRPAYPMEAARPLSTPPGNPPRPWGGQRGNFTNPVFVQGDSYNNYARGRGGQRYNNNSYYDSGRGRGRSFGNNRSPRDHAAEERPNMYHLKGMLEDPWKGMIPVVWKGVKKVSVSEKNWLPKSISTKKAKISSEASSHISVSQPSLAEYLAASFNEDIDGKQDNGDDDDKLDNEDVADKLDNEDIDDKLDA